MGNDKVLFMTESPRGHDEFEVPKEQVQEKIVEQLEEGKMVTVEKENGDSQVITSKQDLKPAEGEKKADWQGFFGGKKEEDKNPFKDAKTVMASKPMKGG